METHQRITSTVMPVLRLLLAALFLYAGVAKLLDVATFAAQLQRLGVTNPFVASAVAHYLPFLELACGLALAFRRCTAGAATLYVGLLLIFEAGLGHAWASGIQVDCGCFGQLFGSASVQAAFLRNLGLLAVASLVLRREIFGKLSSFQERARRFGPVHSANGVRMVLPDTDMMKRAKTMQ